MNKRFMTMLLVACILGIPGCENTPSPDNPEDEIKQEPFEYPTDFYQSFTRANIYSNGIPEQYRWTDYKALAEKFHNLAFDTSAAGNWLPLSRMNGGRIEMQTYVSNVFGNEGITLIPAMVSASLNGFDLTGKLQTADSFFNTTEGVITNNAGSSSAGMSMWYMLFPALHYTWLSLLNPNEAAMRQNCLATIGRWYDAYQLMKDSHFISIYLSNFTARNFNFAVNNVVNKPSGGNWAEPDCAAGMAVLFYNGYKLSGDQKYLAAARYLLDWLDSAEGGPLYEVLHYYTPSLMAVFNAFHDCSYDITKALNENFNGTAAARNGWGAMAGRWGDLPVNGLFGSVTDRRGYAFSMNTFAAAGAMAPLVRYDARYARSIGKWLLYLHSNARYYFAKETPQANQSYYNSAVFSDLPVPQSVIEAIPYEGIIKDHDKTPWIGGDPTINGWAATDFSLYSGNQTGILGALYSQTNVEGILKINVSVTCIFPIDEWPGFLLYNPHSTGKQINYTVSSNVPVNLFDTVLNKTLAKNVSGTVTITLPANIATVIAEVPSSLEITKQGRLYLADGKYVSTDFSMDE